MRNVRQWVMVVVIAGAVSTGFGCSGSAESGAPATSSATTARPAAGKIDACSLLSDSEATAVLAAPIVRKGPAGGVGESICEWATADETSVTVSVGTKGTAPGNRFDPTGGVPNLKVEAVAAPANSFYIGLGILLFPAGERENSVQVVTLTSVGGDRPAAERLAPVLADRIVKAG